MRRVLALLALASLVGTALAIDPPYHQSEWGYGDGIIPDSTSVTSPPIAIGGCGGVNVMVTGYGADSVSYVIQSSNDAIYWYTEDSDALVDWSTAPTGDDTTILQVNYLGAAATRSRPFANWVRLILTNDGADSLFTVAWAVCANCR